MSSVSMPKPKYDARQKRHVRMPAVLDLPAISKHVFFALIALGMALFVLGKFNPFYIPTVDDAAIVMRYLENFQHGYFFTYNVQDGPVFGISSFLWGIACGFVAWLGLAPQAALMVVSFISCALFFYTVMLIINQLCKLTALTVFTFFLVYLCMYFTPKALYLGLETPLNLWLVALTFYFFFEKKSRILFVVAAFCVISKLDTCLVAGGLVAAYILRACIEKREAFRPFVQAGLFFVLPLVVWGSCAALIFHSPIPQSFLAKYYLHAKAPHTSWFPFVEPFLDGPLGPPSVALVGAATVGAFIVAFLRRTIFTHSAMFALALIGTLFLYYLYNPGEKMPWYYPLPEWLGIMTAACLPFDARRIGPHFIRWPLALVSIAIFAVLAHTRYPMNRDAISQAVYWQTVFEEERLESGKLSNDVAPKGNPVLWTGHGYPAYLFNGYVADYSGLNTRQIWKALKAIRNPDASTTSFLKDMDLESAPLEAKVQYFLIKQDAANVFMKHDLFTQDQQRVLQTRLAGSFYTIALVNAPAFRVFVKDSAAPEISEAVQLTQNPGLKPNKLSVSNKAINLVIPAQSKRLDFGVRMDAAEQAVLLIGSDQAVLGRCIVPSLSSAGVPVKVHACSVGLTPASGMPINVKLARADGQPVEIFEPSAARSAQSGNDVAGSRAGAP